MIIRYFRGLLSVLIIALALIAPVMAEGAQNEIVGLYEHEKGEAKLTFKAPNVVVMRTKGGDESQGTYTIKSNSVTIKINNSEEEFEIRSSGKYLKAKDSFGGSYTRK